jgi:hypothetical protein
MYVYILLEIAFLPRYINIATNRYKKETTVGTNNTTKPKRNKRINKRRRKMESNVDKVGSTTTLMIRNRAAPSEEFPPRS